MATAKMGHSPAGPISAFPTMGLAFRASAVFACGFFLLHFFFFSMRGPFPSFLPFIFLLRAVSEPSSLVAAFGNPGEPLWGTWNFHENHHIFGKTGFKKISLPAAGYATHFGECARSRLGTLRDRLSSLSSIDSQVFSSRGRFHANLGRPEVRDVSDLTFLGKSVKNGFEEEI